MTNLFIGVDTHTPDVRPQQYNPDCGWAFCMACDKDFLSTDFVTFLPLGPGQDIQEASLAAAGLPFVAAAAILHYTCVTGKQVGE